MTKYQRPRSHYAVLIFNIAIVALLLVVGGGLLYAGQRLGERHVVSLNRGVDVAVNEDAQLLTSDQLNLMSLIHILTRRLIEERRLWV